MSQTFESVMHCLFLAIHEVNLQLPKEKRLKPSPQTPLFGAGGSLDSLGMVNLIVAAEQELENKLSVQLSILESMPLDPEQPVFSTVESLARYMVELIEKKRND